MTIEDGLERHAIEILGLASIGGGMVASLVGIFYFRSMRSHVKPQKLGLLPFLGPAILLMPSLYDEIGNRARVRLIVSLLMLAFLFAVTALAVDVLRG